MSDRQTLRLCNDIVQTLLEDPDVKLCEDASAEHLHELLYLLDELENLHAFLDQKDIPLQDENGLPLNLGQRVAMLASRSTPKQLALDFYGKPIQPDPKQGQLL